MRRRMLAALLAVGALLLAGCADPLKGGGEGARGGQIIIGASSVGETQLIAEIYAGALRATGADVVVQPPAGSREVVVQALQDNSLSLVPDYSGNLLQYFDPEFTVTTSDEVYTELAKKLPPTLEVLRQAQAQNTDQMVVTRKLADEGVRTISDLAPRCQDYKFGGPGEWAQRWQQRIKELYGCNFPNENIITTDVGGPVTIEALRSGEVQVANLFSTDSRIDTNGFVPLKDDKNMYPAQNIIPLAAKGALTPEQQDALNKVSARLTTDVLTTMDDQYLVEKLDPLDIAQEFLGKAGITAG